MSNKAADPVGDMTSVSTGIKRCSALGGALVLLVGAGMLLRLPTASYAADASWSLTANPSTGREGPISVSLADGRVLLAGGIVPSAYSATAEIYDPATATWSPTGSMTAGRAYAYSTRLLDGRVLVVGTQTASGVAGATPTSAEIYDPTSGTWSSTGSTLVRHGSAASLTTLLDGRVLLAGGRGDFSSGEEFLARAELFDPSTGQWSSTGAMNQGRDDHTAVRLEDGRVLVAGGWGSIYNPFTVSSAEIFDPGTQTWTKTPRMPSDRGSATGVLMGSGQVLIAGGQSSQTILNSTVVYTPSTGEWFEGPSMTYPRVGATLTVMPTGVALLAGGTDGTSRNDSGLKPLIFYPSVGGWLTTALMNITHVGGGAHLLPGGRLLRLGGASPEIFNPPTAPQTSPSPSTGPSGGPSASPSPSPTPVPQATGVNPLIRLSQTSKKAVVTFDP